MALTNFGPFSQDVVVGVREQDDSLGPESLGVPNSAGGAIEGTVSLDHDDGVGEVVVVEPDHVVEVGEPSKMTINKPTLLDHVGTVDNLRRASL